MPPFADGEIERTRETRECDRSESNPTSVVVLVRDRLVGARLSAAFRPVRVHLVHSVADLHAAMAKYGAQVACVLAEARDDRDHPVAPALAKLIERHPFVLFLGYCSTAPHHAAHVQELVRAGVHDLVFAHVDDQPALLRARVVGGDEACAASAVRTRLVGLVPPTLRHLIDHYSQFPRESHDVGSIAAALGVERRTVTNWCRRAHMPSPREIVTWVRLLLAVELLRSPSQCVEHVANTLGFASASAFRNLCRRHFNTRPTDLRTTEGRELAYAAFARAMNGPCEPRRARPISQCDDAGGPRVQNGDVRIVPMA